MRLTGHTVRGAVASEGGRHGLFLQVGTTQELEALRAGKFVETAGQWIAIFNLGGKY